MGGVRGQCVHRAAAPPDHLRALWTNQLTAGGKTLIRDSGRGGVRICFKNENLTFAGFQPVEALIQSPLQYHRGLLVLRPEGFKPSNHQSVLINLGTAGQSLSSTNVSGWTSNSTTRRGQKHANRDETDLQVKTQIKAGVSVSLCSNTALERGS